MRPVLLVSEFFPPQPGGIQRSLELLRPAWGDDVRVITPVEQTVYPGLRRSLFSGRLRPRWLWLVNQFWQEASAGRRLIVFGHYSAAVAAAWALKPIGIRYVVLAHGHDVLSELARPMGSMVKHHLRGAEWVGVNSTWLTKKLHQLGVPLARLIKTHPAVADNEVSVPLSNKQDLRLITIARLVPRKNLANVLRAVAELKNEWPNIQYDVVGDGPEKEPLQALGKSLGLEDQVVWHGQTDDETRRRLLKEASIFVLAPTVRESGADIEGLGAVYLEAAAAGLPLVGSATGGIPDVVVDGVTGLIVDPESVNSITSALRRLLQDPDLRQKLGLAAKQLIETEFRASIRTARAATMIHGLPANQQPKISIVIPAYNSASTMRATLQSVFSQTWKNFEVIVVDDGSTDDLVTTVAPYRERITFIQQPNGGAPAARNSGAVVATGEYLLFLDSDIVMVPEMLMIMGRALFLHSNVAYVYSDFKFGIKDFHLFDFSGERLRQTNYIHTSSLIRRRAWPEFDVRLKRFQDWDMWLTMLARGQIGLWVQQRLFSVSQANGTMSAWVPSFVYKLPLVGQGQGNENIRRYRAAEVVIRQKHHLT